MSEIITSKSINMCKTLWCHFQSVKKKNRVCLPAYTVAVTGWTLPNLTEDKFVSALLFLGWHSLFLVVGRTSEWLLHPLCAAQCGYVWVPHLFQGQPQAGDDLLECVSAPLLPPLRPQHRPFNFWLWWMWSDTLPLNRVTQSLPLPQEAQDPSLL